MNSIRVSELAKELGMTSKEVIEKFGEVDIMVKSHSNTVTPTQIRKLKEHLGLLPKKSNSKPKAFVVKKSKAPATEEATASKKEESKEEVSQESQDELDALQKEYNEKHSDYAHEILRRITEV